MSAVLIAAALATGAPVERQLSAPGPLAPLAGTLLDANAMHTDTAAMETVCDESKSQLLAAVWAYFRPTHPVFF